VTMTMSERERAERRARQRELAEVAAAQRLGDLVGAHEGTMGLDRIARNPGERSPRPLISGHQDRVGCVHVKAADSRAALIPSTEDVALIGSTRTRRITAVARSASSPPSSSWINKLVSAGRPP
jgi:hypothetical protein